MPPWHYDSETDHGTSAGVANDGDDDGDIHDNNPDYDDDDDGDAGCGADWCDNVAPY